jgi:hypothetical protein
MSEIKHTPGPLFVRQPEKWPFHVEIVNEAGEIVASEHRYAYSTSHKTINDVMTARGFRMDDADKAIAANERQLADAYLRAAAPELLEALKEAIETIKFLSTRDNSWGEQIVCEDLQAIVAKATGSQA